MASPIKHVRTQDHWIVTVVAIVVFIANTLRVYELWQWNDFRAIVTPTFFGLAGAYVFYRALMKIDADEQGVRVIAPHGIYALDWSAVKTVEVKGASIRFFGENKVVAYNLPLVGKGKRDVKDFVANMIQRHQIQEGRPVGLKDSQIWPMLRNAKMRGFGLSDRTRNPLVQWGVTVVVFILLMTYCNRVNSPSASGRISALLNAKCVVDTLHMEKTSGPAARANTSRIVAELIVPEGLKAQPEHDNPVAIIEIKEHEIRFSINPPYRESREHQAYVQKTLEEWRDRAIERCDGK